MWKPLAILLLVLVAVVAEGADSSHAALVSLCDPAKIATITTERGANPRIRKIAYWLEAARINGQDPMAAMNSVMDAIGWGGTLKGQLTAEAMVRNRIIAERLGCLDASGMELLRRGSAPTITFGPYTGQKLTVDHIIPRAVAPQLDTLLANLEFMPAHMNFSKGAKIGQRQVDLAAKLFRAGVLSSAERDLIQNRAPAGYGR